MAKNIFAGFFASLLALIGSAVTAQAACSSYPYTLTNGTSADASQVMADFNCAALTSGAAINGATLTGTTTLPGSGTILPSGHLVVGSTLDLANLASKVADGTYLLGLSGTTKGLRVLTTSSFTSIEGLDNTYIRPISPLRLMAQNCILLFLVRRQGVGGSDGSLLVGTTTNSGWSGYASLEVKAPNKHGVSAWVASGTGNNAMMARVEFNI